MERLKKQASKRKFELISFPDNEKLKDEIRLEKSVSDLVETFRELADLERIAGREGLTATVYIAVTSVLMDATHLALNQERRDHHVVDG